MPTSQVADLLSVEAESAMHLADIALLKVQREDLKKQLARTKPSWVHMIVGGAVGVTVGGGVGLTVAAHYNGTGGR